ncbi:transglutaminase domain-containing protein [Lacrimispora sp.]|uniref:transglutaminase domain-containing protein n=1 Tax=Lacrimispora sp. TaxID=2719234 RepID=UPI0028A714AA|nr:hypothetical protein [Lacrimispora sp.]
MNVQFLSFLPILASLILTAPVSEPTAATQKNSGLIPQWEDTFPSPVAVIQLPKGLSDDSIFNLIDNYEINCASFPCEATDLSFTPLSENGDFRTYEIRLSMQASEGSLKTAADSLSFAMIQMAEDVRRTAPSNLPQDLLNTAFQKISGIASYDYALASLSGTGRMAESMHFDRTAYGALVTKNTVCTGYSRALKGICDQLGIPCWVITGTKKGIEHSWNAVKLGNQTSYIDCTAAAVGEQELDPFLFDKALADQYQYSPASYSIPPWESGS